MRSKIIAKGKKKLTINAAEFNIVRLIPNIATIAALCMGLTAIRFGIIGKFDYAVLCIIAAAFFDGIDGRLARLLNATSDFGAEMDSLADFISFGVAPAIIIYLSTMYQWHNIGWGIALFFAVCTAFRLARFNVMNIGNRSQASTVAPDKFVNKFMGVPAPAGAMLILFPLILCFGFDGPLIINPYIYSIVLLATGLLLISRIPTLSFKSLTFKRNWMFFVLLCMAVIIVGLIIDHWITLSILILTYLSTVIYSLIQNFRSN